VIKAYVKCKENELQQKSYLNNRSVLKLLKIGMINSISGIRFVFMVFIEIIIENKVMGNIL